MITSICDVACSFSQEMVLVTSYAPTVSRARALPATALCGFFVCMGIQQPLPIEEETT